MSEDVKKVEVEKATTEVVFKPKKTETVKAFFKKNGKKIGVGALAAATAVGGFVLGSKFLSKKDDSYESWTDEDGASHVSFTDGDSNVEVIETPM